MQAQVILALERALAAAASPALAQSLQRYFPAETVLLGVSNATVGTIARAAGARHPALSADDWLAIARHFARAHACHEHFMLASAVAATVARGLDDDASLLVQLHDWLEKDVRNWAQCDDLCIKPLYIHLKRHPHLLERVLAWGSSNSPWSRRASNVALVKFVGRSSEVKLASVLANCARLLADPDPYVQKGIGWMLKVASQYEEGPVLAFLHQHRAAMARPTLRYAIEKLPKSMRVAFMNGSA